MAADYQIPAQNISVEIDVRKSRFICHLAQAGSAVEAKQFIADVSLKYQDATHNCWAFQTEEPGSTRSIGCSDDGEPHGTAGKPMLNVLCHSDVGEAVAVVSRYYGGTKLGTGGLARAYSDSVKAALAELKLRPKVDWSFAQLAIEYGQQSAVEKILRDAGAEILDSQFDEKVNRKIRYNSDELVEMNHQLKNLSKGQLLIRSDSLS
ncbi:MAG: YigZ family protein [Gammaproteobacteria bacterium]|nr:MAG: YigZ family protein [Gammaproteobacteria bacterium]